MPPSPRPNRYLRSSVERGGDGAELVLLDEVVLHQLEDAADSDDVALGLLVGGEAAGVPGAGAALGVADEGHVVQVGLGQAAPAGGVHGEDEELVVPVAEGAGRVLEGVARRAGREHGVRVELPRLGQGPPQEEVLGVLRAGGRRGGR
jgi:hypothetical protein